ncbi:hypothetical protein ABAC460_17355 [Asticcacaulis sp. AC460]|uniref:TraB/VirB10 family protein n=1 Tax=Asticcacaulis sp. AC460 TaxID=1282360 RepID=UPI0003C3E225|nr:TraB/VirB10 family protein [Asticcacaulis sp. AC460]ESQ87959.1 hypothetical protein ABAC460_17355 [Asticcacaulis sp. AC460]
MSIPDPIPESVDDIGNPNVQARRGQNLRWLLIVGAAAVLGALVFYMMNFKKPAGAAAVQQKALEQRSLATANVAAPAAISPEAENTKLRGQMADLQQQLQTTMDQNAQLTSQNQMLGQPGVVLNDPPVQTYVPRTRRGAAYNQTGSQTPAPGDAASIPPAQSAASPLFAGAATAGEGAGAPKRSIRLLTVGNSLEAAPAASTAAAGTAGDGAGTDKVSIYDSSQYVAPNSYVLAKVLVGVDMQTGIASTADPKPVLFRIEGSAIGVGADGKYQTSNLNGCLVNGAAFAELSSEKVYIKLQKITCAVDGNHTLVSKVDGYVTYMGKSGVRGRVVSREGNFAGKAMVAGTLQGLGQAMSTNVQRSQTAITTTGSGGSLATVPLSSSQIAQDALGTGVGNASSMLADYYIKRAEQYQPVIEMPTGMDVELVFLDGFRFTNKGSTK